MQQIMAAEQDYFRMDGHALYHLGERLAVAPAKWKLEFKKDVIAGCH